MSQYLEVFLRKKDEFTYLCSFSRSSKVYQIINNCVPYEKVRKVVAEDFKDWQEEAKKVVSDYKRQLQEIEDTMSQINSFNNTVDEKVEAIGGLICEKNDILEELEWANDALSWIVHLYVIMDSLQYVDDEEDKQEMYMGIEAGRPTLEDVVE